MKVIAMYLPQFHEVEDNNKWWGEGFTDWVSAKKAKPLFEGHDQPNIPLNDNYYDLMDINTLKWQSELMKKYMIDGLCFYHYYFKDGKKILEKPAELLLENKEIDMPFCFCWANETWARSWSNVKNANVWSAVEEPKNKEGKEVLLEQSYGEYEDWKKHILYLIDFFKDDRYIKIDNKPVFLIYKPDLIIELQKMITAWKEVLEEAGINGIYVIGMNNSSMSDGAMDADDWVDEEVYIQFQEYMNKNVDLITFRKCVDKEKSGIINLEESYKEGLYNREEIEKCILPTVIWNLKKNKPDLTESLYDKIFKKSLLEYSYNLASQVPKLHYGEDPLILFPILEKIDTLYVSNKVLYHYRQHLNETPAYIKSNDFFQKANAWFEYLADKVDKIPDGRKQLEYLYLHLLDNRREMYGDYVKNNEFMFPFDKVKKGSNIILYGAGKVGDTYTSQLERVDYCNVIAWVDKNYQIYLPDKKVESIEIISEMENYDYIVIAIDSTDTREKVAEWLLSIGVSSKKIV